MIKQVKFVKLQEVISRALRSPLMKDEVNMEAAVLYCIDFIHIFGLPEMYLDKEVNIPIHKFRGELPCDLIMINLVKDTCSGVCLRSMTATFFPDKEERGKITGYTKYSDELTFKVLNHIIFTSFEEGEVKISYKAIPVDEDGFPLIPDNPLYHMTLELYIKVQVFTNLFELGKIKGDVLTHAEQQYAWRAGQLNSEYNIPSESEMESICRSWNTLIQRTTDFDNGFKNLGDREYLRLH